MKKNKDQSKDQFSYRISAVATNELDSRIVKEGYFKSKAEFSINDILKDIARLKKMKIEKSAEKDIKDALVKNVISHYPKVAKMDKKLKIAIFLEVEASNNSKMKQAELDDINEALDNYAKEIEEISKQTKIKICLPEEKK